MKKICIIVMSFFLMLSSVSIACQNNFNDTSTLSPSFETLVNQPSSDAIFKVGIVLPLTGEAGEQGREMLVGYELWRAAVEKKGGLLIHGRRYRLKMIYLDTQSHTKILPHLFEELVTQHHIDILLPTVGAAENKMMQRLAKQSHLPFIVMTDMPSILWHDSEFKQRFSNYYHLNLTPLSQKAWTIGNFLQNALFHLNFHEMNFMITQTLTRS